MVPVGHPFEAARGYGGSSRSCFIPATISKHATEDSTKDDIVGTTQKIDKSLGCAAGFCPIFEVLQADTLYEGCKEHSAE